MDATIGAVKSGCPLFFSGGGGLAEDGGVAGHRDACSARDEPSVVKGGLVTSTQMLIHCICGPIPCGGDGWRRRGLRERWWSQM